MFGINSHNNGTGLDESRGFFVVYMSEPPAVPCLRDAVRQAGNPSTSTKVTSKVLNYNCILEVFLLLHLSEQ